MKIREGVSVYEFDEWRKLPEVVDMQIESADCENCDGSGECVCDNCGSEHDCGICDGSGKEYGDLMKLYAQELKEELKKMLRWRDAVLKSAETEG
jgi:hypothetical protein